MGVHANIPFYVDMVRAKTIDDLEEDILVIEASQMTPVQIVIRDLFDRILLVLKTNGNVPTDVEMRLEKILNHMLLLAADEVSVNQRVVANIVEQLQLILSENNIAPHILIEAARGTIFYADLIIATSNLTPAQYTVAALCDEIGFMITANSVISLDLAVALEQLKADLVLSVGNDVETSINLDASIVEQVAMIMEQYQLNPAVLIDMFRESAIHNDLVLRARDGVEAHPTIELEEVNNDLILRTENGLEIGPISTVLERINNTMEFNLSKHLMRIKDWDPELLSETDEWQLGRMIDVPFEMALAIRTVEDGNGHLNLVIQAQDNVDVVITHPIVIGTVDLKKIGELDPYPVPDSTSEST